VYADDHLLPWFRSLVGGLPGVRLFDAHTHLGGDDPDGWRCAPDELTDAVALVDGRAAVFPLMERAGYRDANDSVLAAATASQVGSSRSVAWTRERTRWGSSSAALPPAPAA
jgi:hypothetical protein